MLFLLSPIRTFLFNTCQCLCEHRDTVFIVLWIIYTCCSLVYNTPYLYSHLHYFFNMKPSVLPALLAVFSLVFIAGCVGGPTASNCSTDLTCFAVAAKTCTPSSVTSVQSGITTYLEVKGGTASLCNIYVEVKKSPGLIEMQDKSMTCTLPAEQMNFSATITSKNVLMNCKGTLASYLLGLAPAPTGSDIVTPLGLYTVQTAPCTENETATCDIDGCGGAMACTDGIWTACIKTDFNCGVTSSTQKCSDGTSFGQCSANKPAFCDNNLLVSRCSICGCQTGLTCRNNTCIIAPSGGGGGGGGTGPSGPGSGGGGQPSTPQTCNPGFVWNATNNSCTFTGCAAPEGTIDVGACSTEKPRYCTMTASLGYNCQKCGCLNASYVCQSDQTCRIANGCEDNTLWGQCSVTKPKYCRNNTNTLADNCSLCGCSAGYSCNAQTGSCYVTPPSCTDGTEQYTCAASKPQYCGYELAVVDNCVTCGCTSGLVCNPYTYKCVSQLDDVSGCLDVAVLNTTAVSSRDPAYGLGDPYFLLTQSFVPNSNQLKRVKFFARRASQTALGAVFQVSIKNNYTDVTDLISKTKTPNELPLAGEIREFEFVFDTPLSVTPGQLYYLYFYADQSWISIYGSVSSIYSAGSSIRGSRQTNGSIDWIDNGQDIFFKIYSC